jgi:hypothetical protein
MAKLIYSSITSLDGHIEDENGNFDWAAPDQEVHSFGSQFSRAAASSAGRSILIIPIMASMALG